MARNVMSDLARLKALSSSLGRRGRRVSGMSRQMQAIVKNSEREVNRKGFMEDIVQARFDNERGYADGGLAWASRKDSGDGHPILQDTGRLLQAALRAVRNTYNILKVRWQIARVNVPYGLYHQQGTSKMPRRPFLNDPTKSELNPADSYCVKIARKLLRRALG